MTRRPLIRTVDVVDLDRLLTDRREPAVQFAHVVKHHGAVRALDGVDLTVARGEIVALLGPNGSGKSTAFELLLGLVRPSAGEVRVLGGRAGGPVRDHVGAMLQSGELPEHTTVSELIGLIGRSYPTALPVGPLLAQVDLRDRANALVGSLSGGERQRVRLAMALVGAPRLLLLDEPTAAMDVAARREFWSQVRASVRGGATLLFATHDLHEASSVADRVIVLRQGRVVADAPPAELTSAGGIELEDVFLELTEAGTASRWSVGDE